MTWRRLAAVLLLLGACSTHVSGEASECVTLWNDGGPRGSVATEGYTLADVIPNENKAGQRGCGLLFHSGHGEPWQLYGIIIENGAIGNWTSVAGSSWGTDSPEGPIQVTVGVHSNGSLSPAEAYA
jgi:hypothetical protein